jgi:hypothetical protein
MWVLFLARYDFSPPERRGRTTIVYQPGTLALVRGICARLSIAGGYAVKAARPPREARR